jgi:hypothetical protein
MKWKGARLVGLAALAGTVGLLAAAYTGCGGGSRTAEGALVLEVYLDPAVAGELEPERLARRIERTVESALDGRVAVDVQFVTEAFEPRLRVAAGALAAEIGLPQRHAAYLESAGRDASAMTAARDAFRAAEAELRQRVRAEALVALPASHVGVEVLGARQHGAARVGAERWVQVQAGVARGAYGRGETFEQSVANSVVQGLGLLAGLAERDGAPADAMATRLDVAGGELRARDERGVRFAANEREQAIRALVALSKES